MPTEYMGRIQPRWMKTSEAARHLGRSVAWLKDRIGTDFIEGVHYRRKPGVAGAFWDRVELDKWVMGTGDDEADAILEKMKMVS